ncbi:hypothetical protein [Deferribacter abyssi]|uniref:hypothetical protein n=1 Tax=Deferribacter abyssi TaxID=213806 RepID=UPI003C16A82B
MSAVKDLEMVDRLNVALRKLCMVVELMEGVAVQTSDRQLKMAYEGVVMVLSEVAEVVRDALEE